MKVSGEAYIFGLLDCVGELGRIIHDSQNRTEYVIQIFTTNGRIVCRVRTVYGNFPTVKIQRSKQKIYANLKHRIDQSGGQVVKCRELLGNLGTLLPKHGPYV